MRRVPRRIDQLLRRNRICVVDVGARGGWPNKWLPLRPWLYLVGFEPEPEEFERLRSGAGADEVYLQDALYSEDTEVVLHQTRDANCSSIYRPNHAVIRQFRPNDDRLDVVGLERLRVTTLDSALEDIDVPFVHFIKLDTQGSELDILRGARRTLGGGVIGVEAEVEFVPIYEDQPLFPDVHRFMVDQGFVLMDFPRTVTLSGFEAATPMSERAGASSGLWRRARRFVSRNIGGWRGASQILYADAVYLRDVNHLIELMSRDTDRAELVAARAVAISSACSCYGHARRVVHAGRERGLLEEELCSDLLRTVSELSRGFPRLVTDVKRVVRGLRGRIAHLGG